MPPTDYKVLADHGKHAAIVAPLLLTGIRARLRAWWSRLFNRGESSVEGYKFVGYR